MTRVLTIDPGSSIGWAHGDLGGKPIYGTHTLPQGAKLSRIGLALEAFVMDMLKANQIDKVYFEEPILISTNGFQALSAILAKPMVIAMTCERLGVQAIPIAISTWRSGFGVPARAPKQMPNKTSADKALRRNWMKKQTIDRCIQLGFDPKDDNAADALAMWVGLSWKHQRKAAQPDLLDGLSV